MKQSKQVKGTTEGANTPNAASSELAIVPNFEMGIIQAAPHMSKLLALAGDLTMDKILKADGIQDKRLQRIEVLRALYKDCLIKMKRYETEANTLKAEIAAYKPQSIGNTEGVADEIGDLIYECSRQFNVNNNLDEKQIDFLAESILKEYPLFKIEEVAMILKRGILGNYGKVDFKLDANSIHIWFKKYKEQKDEYYHNQRIAKEDREVRNSYI